MAAALVASIYSDAANAFTDLTDWLAEFSSHWWFLLIIFAVAYLDSVIPIVPGETMVIIGGVAAGQGEQSLLLVIVAGASGAFLGDNTAYYIGSKLSGFIARQAARREKWQGRLDWAAQQIRLRGGVLLITARFIPGGRSVLTISSGITRQPKAWFMGWIALAAAIWATYAAGLGYFGGKTFEDDHTKAFIVAFSAALGMTLVVEVVRHFRARNKPKVDLEVGS
jgi:membrane protein DedA with SNARE-associated domain